MEVTDLHVRLESMSSELEQERTKCFGKEAVALDLKAELALRTEEVERIRCESDAVAADLRSQLAQTAAEALKHKEASDTLRDELKEEVAVVTAQKDAELKQVRLESDATVFDLKAQLESATAESCKSQENKEMVATLQAELQEQRAAVADLKAVLQKSIEERDSAREAAASTLQETKETNGSMMEQKAELYRITQESASRWKEIETLRTQVEQAGNERKLAEVVKSALQQTITNRDAELEQVKAESANRLEEVNVLKEQVGKLKKSMEDGWVMVADGE